MIRVMAWQSYDLLRIFLCPSCHLPKDSQDDRSPLMKFISRILCLYAVGLLVASAAPAEERIWTGVNGKTFRGTFLTFEENRTKAVFITTTNQQLIIALENLIPADRDRLIPPAAVMPPAQAPAAAAGAPDGGEGFKKLPIANRGLIPTLKPKDFGASDYEALVDAIWIALLWWEKAGILEVPGRGDFEKRAEKLHEELSREISQGGRSSSTLEEGKQGIEAYFKDELEDTAGCRVKIMKDKPTVPLIAGALTDRTAVVMKMSMTYDNGRDFSIAALLESLTPDGNFVFHIFGTRLNGTVKTAADGSQEWIITNRNAIPDYYREQGPRFFFNKDHWNGLLLMDPFVYATKGKPVPLPPEQPIKPAQPVTPIR